MIWCVFVAGRSPLWVDADSAAAAAQQTITSVVELGWEVHVAPASRVETFTVGLISNVEVVER